MLLAAKSSSKPTLELGLHLAEQSKVGVLLTSQIPHTGACEFAEAGPSCKETLHVIREDALDIRAPRLSLVVKSMEVHRMRPGGKLRAGSCRLEEQQGIKYSKQDWQEIFTILWNPKHLIAPSKAEELYRILRLLCYSTAACLQCLSAQVLVEEHRCCPGTLRSSKAPCSRVGYFYGVDSGRRRSAGLAIFSSPSRALSLRLRVPSM